MKPFKYCALLIYVSSLAQFCLPQIINKDCPEPDMCHHNCVAGIDNRFTCSCRDGYTLATNGRDCLSNNEITASGSGSGIDDEPGDDDNDTNGVDGIFRVKSTASITRVKADQINPSTDSVDNGIVKYSTLSSSSEDQMSTAGNDIDPVFGWDCLDHEDCLLKNSGNQANSWLEEGDEAPIVTVVPSLKSTKPYRDNPLFSIHGSRSTSRPNIDDNGSGQTNRNCDDESDCEENYKRMTPATPNISNEIDDIDSNSVAPSVTDSESGSGLGIYTNNPCIDNVDDEDCIGPSPETKAITMTTKAATTETTIKPEISSTVASNEVTRYNPRIAHNNSVVTIKDACQKVKCQFGGKCQLMPKGQFRCLCRLGKSGKYCERDLRFVHPRFSGSSYMVFPREPSTYDKFEITIEFQASGNDGLILYSGQTSSGNKDFFAIILRNGKVEFSYDCGAGHVTITSNIKVTLNAWHILHVVRFGQKGWIQVDSETPVRGSTQSWYSSILTNEIYLGGMTNYNGSIGDVNITKGLRGCVRKFVINGKFFRLHHPGNAVDGLDISDCDATLCKEMECASKSTCMIDHGQAFCLCPFGKTGQLCDEDVTITIPKFAGHGFLQFESLGLDARNDLMIEVVFRPSSTSGLIFYNGDSSSLRGDFISLTLRHGFVEFRFDCGTGAAIIRSLSPVALDKWHTVQLSRRGRKGSMKVDNGKTVVGVSKGAFKLLKLSSPFYVGGLKNFGDISPRAAAHSHFSGCVQKLSVNRRSLDWRNPIDGIAVDSCTSHRCSKSPCHHGTCEPRNDDYICHCHLGYYGTLCDKQKPFDVPSFSGHSYLRFNKTSILKSIKGLRSSISLLFKTSSINGLILWIGGDASADDTWSDYLSIGVSNGMLVVRYDIGNGEEILNSSLRVNDNNWHEVHLSRKYRTARLSVDNNTPIVATSKGKSISLDSRADLHLGGMADIPGTTSYRFDQGFTGCIRGFTVGSTNVHLYKHAVEGHHVQRCL